MTYLNTIKEDVCAVVITHKVYTKSCRQGGFSDICRTPVLDKELKTKGSELLQEGRDSDLY